MDEKEKLYRIEFGEIFISSFNNFPLIDQDKIYDFIYHVENLGFEGLPGRNKSSDEVPKDDPDFLKKVKYARKHNLWHYHIGIPECNRDNSYGDWTSEYILHYSVKNRNILVIDLDYHPPFLLPKEKYLS